MAKTAKPSSSSSTIIYDTIIVGAAISGIAAAFKLKQLGYTHFKIIEKADRVGGTWRDNHYPGCGCDVPSALYSFSFAPSTRWSHLFARQPEILEYLESVSKGFDIERFIEFNTELTKATWNDTDCYWTLETSQGVFLAKTVIFATGPITEPQTPKIEGIETFTGEMFHSARWNHNYDLTGKRIAVVGTGASAIQFIPQIQPLAKQLYVFQRTAPWVLPKPDMPLGKGGKSFFTKYPKAQTLWRNAVAQSLNVINVGLRNPKLLTPFNFLSKQLLKMQVKDPILRQQVTPNFTIGCKRILFANNYYPALQATNTQVIPTGMVKIEGNTVIAANGARHDVDVIIWGTGFEVSHPPIGQRVVNTQGTLLSDLWKNSSAEAYLGTAIENVPNAFLVLGPNILVYDSFIGIAEAQVGYIADGLIQMKQRGIDKLTINPRVLREYNQMIQKHIKTTVFNSGGCKSYYLDANGRNFAAWPFSLQQLKDRLQTLQLGDYDVVYHTEKRKQASLS